MPIIASAKKALKQSQKKNARNTHYKKLYTEARVAFEKAIKAKDLASAKSLYINKLETEGKASKSGLQSIIDKLVKKNIIHANNGSRKKSKFVRMMKQLEQA
jgi:small subunit ribosomal protein S20